MNEDIQFLKDLQHELKTQENDYQASPRFWVLRQYEYEPTGQEWADKSAYIHNDGDYSEFDDIDELIGHLSCYEGLNDEELEKIQNMKNIEDAFEYVLDNHNKDKYYEEISVKKIAKILPNTMFLTKEDAKNHIKGNSHHYNKTVHTYAMTAWRSPKVRRLLEILETFDWGLTEEANDDEKQKPKKIFRHPWNGINNVPYDLCPSCKTNLCTEAGIFANKKMNYCEKCGQKLDWQ